MQNGRNLVSRTRRRSTPTITRFTPLPHEEGSEWPLDDTYFTVCGQSAFQRYDYDDHDDFDNTVFFLHVLTKRAGLQQSLLWSAGAITARST